MEIKHVLIVGAGQMGRQIAMTAAIHGYETIICDSFDQALENAEKWTASYLEGRIAKGRMTKEQTVQIKARLSFCRDITKAAKTADLVIEAIIEEEQDKIDLFCQLEGMTRESAILATNSSFIPSSVMATKIKRRDKTANLHFFNPALVMELVEVVQNQWTSEETVQALMDFARQCGKQPIWVKKEIDGFVANRILADITQEAMFLVEQGIVTPEEVDIAVEKGLNHPMGPFRLMDLVGIDISYLSRVRKFEKSHDEKEKPPKFLEEKYKKGELGRKTGKGWYDYTKA